jgi:hypothetical protein
MNNNFEQLKIRSQKFALDVMKLIDMAMLKPTEQIVPLKKRSIRAHRNIYSIRQNSKRQPMKNHSAFLALRIPHFPNV